MRMPFTKTKILKLVEKHVGKEKSTALIWKLLFWIPISVMDSQKTQQEANGTLTNS